MDLQRSDDPPTATKASWKKGGRLVLRPAGAAEEAALVGASVSFLNAFVSLFC